MLEHWGADVNEAAVYYADPVAWSRHLQYSINTERAIPLFVAANNGHNGIVRYLVEKGADVSVRTRSIGRNYYDGLTPLYGTVIDLRFGNDNLIYQKRIKEENAGIVRFLLEFKIAIELFIFTTTFAIELPRFIYVYPCKT